MYLLTIMKTWNLFRFFKKRNNFAERPVISNPIIISKNLIRDCSELNTKKKIIDAKSKKNLAGLEEIKATLLQWKEEDYQIFTDYKTKNPSFSQSDYRSKFYPGSIATFDFWNNEYNNNENISRPPNIRAKKQVSVRRIERSNSFRALGKVLISKDSREEHTEFL